MTRALPPLLVAMIVAHNAHDADASLACLAEEAVVRDEGHTYVGTATIRAWSETTMRKYAPHVEVTSLSTVDGEPVPPVSFFLRNGRHGRNGRLAL